MDEVYGKIEQAPTEGCSRHPTAYCGRCRQVFETAELEGTMCPDCGNDLEHSLEMHQEECKRIHK